MASRDSQTTQIVLIVFIILTLLLSVVLVMVNNARKTALARAQDADSKAQAANSAARDAQSEANNYKQWLGYPESDNLQTLQTRFAEDILGNEEQKVESRWGKSFELANRNYRHILDSFFEENRKLAQSESDAKAQLKKLNQDLLATQSQMEKQIAQYREEAKQAEADKESLRNEFNSSRDQTNAEKQEIADQLAEQRVKIDEMVASNEQAQDELRDKISKLERVIEILKSKTAIPDPYAQPEDGRIAWVNQREGKVWINLGSEDQLRPQVTFSVYSGDANDVNAAESKGSIEVVRILSEHMAEARITNDRSVRPLMEGDKIYSQVWNRGREVGFAITGIIDLNNDKTDDTELLKRIIQLNNGKVDAVPTEAGEIDGQMTVDTRYLILGKHPEDDRESSEASRAAYQKMSADADTLNVEVITLEDFLSLMGWQAEHRAVKIGKGSRPEDFPARSVKDYKPRILNTSKDFFRPRKPQPSY